jgi:hypothetical protein
MAELSDQWLLMLGRLLCVLQGGLGVAAANHDRSDNSVWEYANILYDSVLPDEVSYEPWNGVLQWWGNGRRTSDGYVSHQ